MPDDGASRFKIDFALGYSQAFNLFHRVKKWGGASWELVDRFSTKDEAIVYYNKIKDLPQYLP